MDPAESIFSMLDFGVDPLHEETLDLGLDDILSSDFNFSSEDNNLIDIFNDDVLNSLDLSDDVYQPDMRLSLPSTIKKGAARNKAKITLSPVKSVPHQSFHKSFSILNNSTANKNGRVTISVNVPKVYISPGHKKSASAASGTSILVKSKRAVKRRSLLQSKEQPKHMDVFGDNFNMHNAFFPALRDHDYCVKLKDDTYTKKECPSFSSSASVSTEVKNELEDMLQGYIPDDVMLNELPNCLQDLMNLDSSFMLNSEDVLHGLNDACNLMTDHYIDDLEQHLFDFDPSLNLPNLDITDDDLNVGTQSSARPIGADECAVKDIEVDIVYSPFAESRSDSFDCASTTTGTEESSSEDTDCRSLKRHRSLSGSSLTSRRKRRFSSRSSLNSSDSMSDTSSLDDSAPSSRSSSPERSLKVLGFGSFASHNSVFNKSNNHSKYHAVKTNRHRKQVTWTNKYSSKYMKPSPTKKKKMKVIDLSNRNFAVPSLKGLARLDTGSSLQASGANEVNEKVLYIGDIPSGTKKLDLHAWFSKFGTIEDIQTYFCDNGNNYAFITYKYSHETRKAIKYGNEDVRHSKFTLSYGKRRSNSYKDLDLFTESSLDFRIETDKDVLDFDTLLRSTTAESHKLTKYI